MNSSTTPPTLSYPQPILISGKPLDVIGVPPDQLPIMVGTIGTGAANAKGNYATTISVDDTESESLPLKSVPGVYLYTASPNRFSKVARFGDEAPDGSLYGGNFGDVALDDDDVVTFPAAATTNVEAPISTSVNSSGALSAGRNPRANFVGSQLLVRVSASGASTLLLRSGEMLPGTTAMIENFGLIDVCRDHYIAQVSARRVDQVNTRPGSAVVLGRISSPFRRMQAAEPHLLSTTLQRSGEVILGASIIGPRVGVDGFAALVTHDRKFIDDEGAFENHRLTTLTASGIQTLVATAGERLRRGGLQADDVPYVVALGGPVVSSEARITFFVELLSDGTSRLKKSEGSTETIILQSGDLVDGLKITEINQGYHPAQVGVGGRVAFAAEFLRSTDADPSKPENILTSLIVGIPT